MINNQVVIGARKMVDDAVRNIIDNTNAVDLGKVIYMKTELPQKFLHLSDYRLENIIAFRLNQKVNKTVIVVNPYTMRGGICGVLTVPILTNLLDGKFIRCHAKSLFGTFNILEDVDLFGDFVN